MSAAQPEAAGPAAIIAGYHEVLEWVGARVRATGDEHWSLPTPCEQWNVAALTAHVIGVIDYYAGVAEGGTEALVLLPVDELTGGRHAAAFAANAERARRVWDQAAVTRGYRVPAVGTATGERLLRIHSADLLLHGWDLARATAQDDRFPPQAAADALDALHLLLPPDAPRGGFFAPPLPVADDADVGRRLLAFSGRAVTGRPG